MTPQVDLVFGTRGGYMLPYHFLKVSANGLIEKLFTSLLKKFLLKKLRIQLDKHFSLFPSTIRMRLVSQIRQDIPKTFENYMI